MVIVVKPNSVFHWAVRELKAWRERALVFRLMCFRSQCSVHLSAATGMFIEKCVFNLVLVNQTLDWVKGKAWNRVCDEASALS